MKNLITSEMSKETLSFVTAEIHQVHALCDRAAVPREIDGELLSMAQRVACLELCYAGLIKRIGKDPVTVIH